METVDGDFDRKTSHASPSHFWNERSACQVSCGPSCGWGDREERRGVGWMLILGIRKGYYQHSNLISRTSKERNHQMKPATVAAPT